MNDKKRRDITLGEMQDECKRVFGGCLLCRVRNECVFNITQQPRDLDLSDPPRFNEAQMALLKVFYDRGYRKVMTGSTTDALADCIMLFLGVGENETLDLAELLGKDGAE